MKILCKTRNVAIYLHCSKHSNSKFWKFILLVRSATFSNFVGFILNILVETWYTDNKTKLDNDLNFKVNAY